MVAMRCSNASVQMTGWFKNAAHIASSLINQAAWATLPMDLQAIVQNALRACNVISAGWCQEARAAAACNPRRSGLLHPHEQQRLLPAVRGLGEDLRA